VRFRSFKNDTPKTKRLQTKIIIGNRVAKLSWSDSKDRYLQATTTLLVEGGAQKTKPKAVLGVGNLSVICRGIARFNPLVLPIKPAKVK
jgi:hypothetical protein